MSDPILDELLSTNPDISPPERLKLLQDLGNTLPKSYVSTFDLKLYNVLRIYLHSKNYDCQKCALNLLYSCLQNKNLATLTDANSFNLVYAIIYLCNNGKEDSVDYKEVWVKAFDVLHLLTEIYPVLSKNHGIRILLVFQKAVTVSYTSAVQKYKALEMLDKYISSVDIRNVKESLYHIFSEQLLPLAFGKNTDNFHGLCLQIDYRLLPVIRQVLIKYPEEWDKIFSDIRNKYVPSIERLIAANNCTFAKLWIFLIKLIGAKFYKGSPVDNSLLSCIKAAFKVPNLEVRKQSFFCWQVLIENFTIESNEASIEKRIKLLTIPLKTNNDKTEELVGLKIKVWYKLLEMLNQNNLIGSYGVLDAYLSFCFGPFCYQDAHGLISQGKKYSSVHLITCKSLLQLIGNPKYIDKDLESKLNVLNFKGPAIKSADFCNLSKSIIDSVGESCVMLSQLDVSDMYVCRLLNEALWKSVFAEVDALDNESAKMKAIREIAHIILVLINVARKKANLINFGLKPLFNILTSYEFNFCQEEQFAELFIPMLGVVMKKDKMLLHDDVMMILRNIFIFKRSSAKSLEFIVEAKNLFLKETFINSDKVNLLRSVWYIIKDELKEYYNDRKGVDEKQFLTIFHEILSWPINTSTFAKSSEVVEAQWRELYSCFGQNSSILLQCQLASLLMASIKKTATKKTNAEYAYYIISNLKLENCYGETCEEISNIYSEVGAIVSSPSLAPDAVVVYESCISHILDTSSKFPEIHRILPSINNCLASLLDIYNKTDIIRPATLFLEQLDKKDEKLKPEIETLTKILDRQKQKETDETKETFTRITRKTKKTESDSHSEDIVQSDSDQQNVAARPKRRRKSTSIQEEMEKMRRDIKRKLSTDSVNGNNTSPNRTSKENVNVNKEDNLPPTVRRKRRSIKAPEKNYASTIENETALSDSITDNSQKSSDAGDEPIKLKLYRNRRRLKIIPPKKINLSLEPNSLTTAAVADGTTKTDDETDSTISSTPSEKDSLISLEANIELNKLENVPIHLVERPARINRGNRRLSEGNVVKKPTPEMSIIDYANPFVLNKNEFVAEDRTEDKVQKKIIRELNKIQMNINNKNDYLKMNGRKTRLSNQIIEKEIPRPRPIEMRQRHPRAVKQITTKPDDNQLEQKPNEPINESEESDIIESSQENEKQISNIKECEVRALYSLEKITSGLLIQESDPNNRPKISPIKINIKSNKLIKPPKEKPEPNTSTSETDVTPDIIKDTPELLLIMDKLDSQNVTIATETESLPSQIQNDDETPICERRKVIMSNSVISTEDETPSTPPRLQNKNNLPTSPVSNDTPTRTKELLEDTLEISPIKKVPTNTTTKNEEILPDVAENPADDNESPDLFETESAVSENADDAEKVSGNTSQYTNRMLRKYKSRVLSGRSAKMMKMISAKQTFVPATTTNGKATTTTTSATAAAGVNKIDTYCSPSSNRTKKMMISLEKSDPMQDMEVTVIPATGTPLNQAGTTEPVINQTDVLCFEKELPSPFALPTGSILKRKRNGIEETTEETIVPVIKKRRVNFSDPPVSCLKFIEKTIKPAFCLPKELRTTRSSMAEEQEIDSEGTNTNPEESHTLSDIVPNEEDAEDDTFLFTNTYNIKPICEALIDNQDPVTKILTKLTNSLDFNDPVTTLLENKNINTIGDLAKLTEAQVFIIPLKVETAKQALREYDESLKATIEKRKITPLVLSTPEKQSEPSTCGEVSVIIENKVNEAIINEYSEILFSSDTEDIPQINRAKSTITSEYCSPIPVTRNTNKTEFDSPTNAKDNILNETYCNIKVAKFLQFIRNLFIEKKFDPKPIITSLFANNPDILNQMNCWKDLVKYIVRDVGIWTLTEYLCSLKNIPALMIESILKNSLNEIGNDFICERLNKHEIIKFLSKECNLISLLQEYDAQTVYSTFFDLANDTQYSRLKYKEMLQELYACVFQPQNEILQILHNLDVGTIGAAVVKRMSDPQEMDVFLEKVHKSVPLEVYLKPTKNLLPIENKDTEKETKTPSTSMSNDDVVATVGHSIGNNVLTKDEEFKILQSIAKKWDALEFFQTFTQQAKTN